MLMTQKLHDAQGTLDSFFNRKELGRVVATLNVTLGRMQQRYDQALTQIEIAGKFKRNAKSEFLSKIPVFIEQAKLLVNEGKWVDLDAALNNMCDVVDDIRREVLTRNQHDWNDLVGNLMGGIPELIQALAELNVAGASVLRVRVDSAAKRTMVDATSVQDLMHVYSEVTELIASQTGGIELIEDFVKRLTSSDGARYEDLNNPEIRKWIDERGILPTLRIRI
jgi:hypothetical protein